MLFSLDLFTVIRKLSGYHLQMEFGFVEIIKCTMIAEQEIYLMDKTCLKTDKIFRMSLLSFYDSFPTQLINGSSFFRSH